MALASGHFTFLIVFDVPGVGFIYVEPQTPVQIVVVEVGQPYCQPNGWPQPPYDDTIEYLTSQPDWS
jgi:hypothetical protein